MTAAQATGKIKLYQSIVGGVLLLNFPLAFLFCSLGFTPVIVFYISIYLTFTAGIVRLFILKSLLEFSIISFIKKVYFPILLSVLVSMVLPFTLNHLLSESIFSFIFITMISLLCTTLSFYFISISKKEKKVFSTMFISKFRKNNA